MKREDIKIGHWYWTGNSAGSQLFKKQCIQALDDGTFIMEHCGCSRYVVELSEIMVEDSRPWWAFWRKPPVITRQIAMTPTAIPDAPRVLDDFTPLNVEETLLIANFLCSCATGFMLPEVFEVRNRKYGLTGPLIQMEVWAVIDAILERVNQSRDSQTDRAPWPIRKPSEE